MHTSFRAESPEYLPCTFLQRLHPGEIIPASRPLHDRLLQNGNSSNSNQSIGIRSETIKSDRRRFSADHGR